ncbi:bifunctional 3-(3-hydroxy-phenyl)propionate/3-hydroxycinnamic acid hydroxylase [Variovorax paradoxus]|uniref:bifunctional 3-(3-hydroxy-phenyl)propionate/3-hydroxycinnamic acid hydroxylase n=1 Tax=Variovorax paradoxus TaxID=34073 RepID=UPI003D656768
MQDTPSPEAGAHAASRAVIDTDVLVVGLGPVGAALANLLGRHGVRVMAIDASPAIFPKPRAIALDSEALRILQAAGVQEGDFATVAIPQVVYHSPVFGPFARMNTTAVRDGHPSLVTFYQPELESVLRERLRQYPEVCVHLGTELRSFIDDGTRVTALVQSRDGSHRTVHARYLVGADGANSLVRRSLGLAFDGASFAQDWLIVDAHEVPHPIDHVEFICDPGRPTPHMVAPNGRQRWEFMLRPGEAREDMERPESIRRLLAPWCDTNSIQIERTAVYRFHARLAAAFSKGRCFLVGDAAHITPPFAGQGLVAGLRDVANLGWKLAWVTRGLASNAILASYDQERRPHARKIIDLARFLGALVMPSNRAAAFLLHGAIRLARILPSGRALFDDMKIKPQNTFAKGLFRHRAKGRLHTGALFPQAWVRHGRTTVLSDEILAADWALVGVGVDPAAQLPEDLLQAWQAVGGRAWQWCHRGQAQHLGPAHRRVEALDDTLHGRLPWGWIVLVRPDRCIFAEGPVEQAADLVRMAIEDLTGAPFTPAPRARGGVEHEPHGAIA